MSSRFSTASPRIGRPRDSRRVSCVASISRAARSTTSWRGCPSGLPPPPLQAMSWRRSSCPTPRSTAPSRDSAGGLPHRHSPRRCWPACGLPVPWPERLLRFARRRRAALATAAAATLAVSGGTAAWLFGSGGLAPGELLALAFSGARTMLVDAMLAAGRLAYRFGLVDASSSIIDRINPAAALGSLALSSLIGLTSLWYMARWFRQPPRQRVRVARAS